MAFPCPHCSHSLKLKTAKPGRYTPKCPQCGRQFQVLIPEEPDRPPVVRPLPGEAPASANPPLKTSPAKPKEERPAEDSPPPAGGPLPEPAACAPPAAKTKPAAAPAVKPASPSRPAPSASDPNLTGAYTPPPVDPDATAVLPASVPDTADPNRTQALPPTEPDLVLVSGAAAEAGPERTRGQASAKTKAGPLPGKKKPQTSKAPTALGGYEVLKELGQGGMGAVYLGRQVSLDRLVALKILKPELAADPAFVARFVREAYAAAHLMHHNVVHIYDIGAQGDTHYFSMEFVKGQSLIDLVKKRGPLDPKAAAGYVLQAARGLKFGHDMGMVHRDVKPDNLLLNNHGIVKVADLGLVKIPVSDPDNAEPAAEAGRPRTPRPVSGPEVTGYGQAVGTPSYMAPEQARDSARVDPRADVYSLGCTLYVLLTGKPPFLGKTPMEVLTKHLTQPVSLPDGFEDRIPKELTAILMKMLAKDPADRYPDMASVIQALKGYLGVRHAGRFEPQAEHVTVLEECQKKFDQAPRARLREYLILGFFTGCAAFTLLSLFLGVWLLAGAFVGLAVLTPLCYLLTQGALEKAPLYVKGRAFVLGSRWSDWLYWAVATLLVVLLLYIFQLLWVWVGICVLAAGLGAAFYFAVDRPLAAERAAAVERAETMLKGMRLQGLEEDALREFVCKYSGRRWEEFYEALFGYEAKLAAREWVLDDEVKRKLRHAAWRDPVIRWFDAREEARREAHERRHLQAVEAKALQAQGMDAAQAREKAEQVADALVETAAKMKQEAARPAAAEETIARPQFRELWAAAQEPESVYQRPRPRQAGGLAPLGHFLAGLLGPGVRFLAGAVLLAGCLLWMYQNDLLEQDKLAGLLGKLVENQDFEELARSGPALELPLVPPAVTDLFSGFGPGVAGLILIVSSLFSGWRVSLLAVPAAVIAFVGPQLGVPAMGPVSAPLVAMVAGLGVAILGFVFLRE
jgi:hypothetical protein